MSSDNRSENPQTAGRQSATRCAVYALLAAAGNGSRMSADVNKQFLEIDGLPVILRTIQSFEHHPEISGYLVIAAATDCDRMMALLKPYPLPKLLGIIPGGSTRQESVLFGLRELGHVLQDSGTGVDPVILVHDGARCLVPAAVIDRCIHAIQEKKVACAAAVPVKDTIKQATDEGKVLGTLDRRTLWAMQTPQGAYFSPLVQAYEDITAKQQTVTDDLAVMEAYGHETYLVPGDYRNIKITTPDDLVIGSALVRDLRS